MTAVSDACLCVHLWLAGRHDLLEQYGCEIERRGDFVIARVRGMRNVSRTDCVFGLW